MFVFQLFLHWMRFISFFQFLFYLFIYLNFFFFAPWGVKTVHPIYRSAINDNFFLSLSEARTFSFHRYIYALSSWGRLDAGKYRHQDIILRFPKCQKGKIRCLIDALQSSAVLILHWFWWDWENNLSTDAEAHITCFVVPCRHESHETVEVWGEKPIAERIEIQCNFSAIEVYSFSKHVSQFVNFRYLH